jgi:hypothetical protein
VSCRVAVFIGPRGSAPRRRAGREAQEAAGKPHEAVSGGDEAGEALGDKAHPAPLRLFPGRSGLLPELELRPRRHLAHLPTPAAVLFAPGAARPPQILSPLRPLELERSQQQWQAQAT